VRARVWRAVRGRKVEVGEVVYGRHLRRERRRIGVCINAIAGAIGVYASVQLWTSSSVS
jgi:hypothetical protein